MRELKPGKQIRFTIGLAPITKKNSQKIGYHTVQKPGQHPVQRPFILPSDNYKKYEHDAVWFMPHDKTITEPVNIRALFYMPSRRRVDLVNLEEALLDVLTRYGVIADDNSLIVQSMDGSRVLYDKDNPRTEVIIEFINQDEGKEEDR